MKPYLGISDPRYACLRTLWVSPAGSDGNDGTTPAKARRTLASTTALATPGTVIRLLPGKYPMGGPDGAIKNGGASDSLVGYVALISDTPLAAKLVPDLARTTFNVLDITAGTANYLILDGLDIQGPLPSLTGGSAIEIKNGHHYKILNCRLHDSAACGLQTASMDYLLLQGCEIFGNAKTGSSHYSGVSLLGPLASDALPGFHFIVRNNFIHDNTEGPLITTNHTDGNGLILDSWGSLHSYSQQALVENNLITNNGHRGIEVLNAYSGGVTLRNNTCYKNGQDSAKYGTEGEIAIWHSPKTIVANNIIVADPVANPNNVALLIDDDTNSTVLDHNLTFNGTVGQASYQSVSTTTVLTAANGNLIGVDPVLALPDLRPSSLSPCLGAGTLAHGFADTDLAGNPRIVDCLIDIGAYQGIGRDN